MANKSGYLKRKNDVPLKVHDLDRIAINVKSHKLLKKLLIENPKLEDIMRKARNETEALIGVKNWVLEELEASPVAMKFYKNELKGRKAFESLRWRDYAAIRILDYIDNAGREFKDLNLRGEIAVSNPMKMIWLAVTLGTGGAKPYFFEDMLELFRQFCGRKIRIVPEKKQGSHFLLIPIIFHFSMLEYHILR